jgi:hypothetical protein
MMDVRSIQDFKKLVASISDKLAQADSFFTIKLATRLTNAAELHPQDQTIIQMATFLSRRANSQGGYVITRKELADVYNKLYTTNTKCGELLAEELGVKADKLPAANQMTRSANEGETIDDLYSRYADNVLSSQLTAAFDGGNGYKLYDQSLEPRAVHIVASHLPGKPKVEVVDGRDFAIICRATYETPKGQSSVLIPVEVSQGCVLNPVVFISQAGIKDLNEESLKDHIISTAGQKFRVDASQVFEAIRRVRFAAPEALDNVDMAVMNFKARVGTPSHAVNGIIYQEVDKIAEAIDDSREESKTFAEQLGSIAGSAEFLFGKQSVAMARSMIANQLENFGYKKAQIKIANVKENSITFAVDVNGAGFKVPVKIASGKPQQPSMILASGNIEEFSKEGVRSALGFNDQKSSAAAMGYDLSRPTDLLNEVTNACTAGDMQRASVAVAAIEQSGDKMAFAHAMATYMSALEGGFNKSASTTNKIKTIKIGGNEVCAQTFLPVDKVYIDEKGVSRAKYRENSEYTDEGMAAGFMNAKILKGL